MAYAFMPQSFSVLNSLLIAMSYYNDLSLKYDFLFLVVSLLYTGWRNDYHSGVEKCKYMS